MRYIGERRYFFIDRSYGPIEECLGCAYKLSSTEVFADVGLQNGILERADHSLMYSSSPDSPSYLSARHRQYAVFMLAPCKPHLGNERDHPEMKKTFTSST